jgi:selenocysteine lyase/cysteine desulfurase
MAELLNLRDAFAVMDGHVWLNNAQQGPMPVLAARSARQMIDAHLSPQLLTEELHQEVSQRLREAISNAVGGLSNEVVLGNSTSFGLHLIANSMEWSSADEVLVVDQDFPANILPWLMLRDRGVRVRLIKPRGGVPDADEVRQMITSATRLCCVTWISPFTGGRASIVEIGAVCRDHNVRCVVNASHVIGAESCELNTLGVDAVACCGYKWLCGPYGTGFCWIASEFIESLKCMQAYWWELEQAGMSSRRPEIPSNRSHRAFDVFGSGNFLTSVPWATSIEFLLGVGLDRIASHNRALASEIVGSIAENSSYQLISPQAVEERTAIVVVTHTDGEQNVKIVERLRCMGIVVALRRQQIRISPHLHNTLDDVRALIVALNRLGR